MGDRPATKPHSQTLDDQASAYVASLVCGASGDERKAIEAWIDADPRHAVAFARMQAAWDAAERLRANPPPLTVAPQTNRARADRSHQPRRRMFFGGLAAAGLAGVAVATGAAVWRAGQRYRTGVGERRTVALADGSTVELNTASLIEVSLRKTSRQVRLLRGEAQFHVAHDTARPFYVEAASARLRAVGTAFNVRIHNDLVELTVTEGVVAVAPRGRSTREAVAPHVAAGGGAVIVAGTVAPAPLGEEALRQRTAWQQGVIELDGETLAQVVEEFNRYQTRPIVIGDARLADLRVGGRFAVNDADKFLLAISSSFPIDVIRTDDGRVLLTERRAESSAPG
ncbi:MAG: FecR domain-containing protein [Caulobacteraceae bacterium]|nr:FecR domain-containing protein [Caulobacteraceae bacterium]